VGVLVGSALSAAMLWHFDDRYLNAGFSARHNGRSLSL
jgi:hypothetical protein